jgi:hypothetical protein
MIPAQLESGHALLKDCAVLLIIRIIRISNMTRFVLNRLSNLFWRPET